MEVKRQKLFWYSSIAIILVLVLILSGLNVQFQKPQNAVIITVGNPVDAFTGTVDQNGVNSAAVQAALNALPASGGHIRLVSPTYTFTATVSRAINNVIWECGGATINYDASHAVITVGSQTGWVFKDLITDAGGITNYANADLYNVTLGATSYSVRLKNTTGNLVAASVTAPTGRTNYVLATSDATALEKSQADAVLTGTADQTLINAAFVSYTNTEVIGININTTGTINLFTSGHNLELAPGTALNYTGTGSAVAIKYTDDLDLGITFKFDTMYGRGDNTSDCGIELLGGSGITIDGKEIGRWGSSLGDFHYCFLKGLWLNTASAIGNTGGRIDIDRIMGGEYGVLLPRSNAATKHFEGSIVNIGAIVGASIDGFKIGQSGGWTQECVMWNYFNISSSNCYRGFEVYDHRNIIVIGALSAGNSVNSILGAESSWNQVIGTELNTITDLGTNNQIITPLSTRIRAYKYTSAQAITAGATYTRIVLDNETYDTLSEFASDNFTATQSGLYEIDAQVVVTVGASAGTIDLQIFNGTTGIARNFQTVLASQVFTIPIRHISYLVVGDIISLKLSNGTSHNVSIAEDNGNGGFNTWLTIRRIQ
jgi:hypothetical protein